MNTTKGSPQATNRMNAIIVGVLFIIGGVIPGFGTIQMTTNMPIALQEMVFAVWLIAKGVNTPATAPKSV